jgi:hypothetical protein
VKGVDLMPLEIIRRKEGEESQKQEIRHSKTQFSINSYGHLCIREFDETNKKYVCTYGREKCYEEANGQERVCMAGNTLCEHYKLVPMNDEHLIVLDKQTTDDLIRFIFSIRGTFEFKELLKEIIRKELPF